MDAPNASNVPNRIEQFCQHAPAPSVLRAKVGPEVEVERVYGAPAPTDKLRKHFADNGDAETLLVSVGKDGNVLGTSWPVFRDQVSLELGIPDMKEGEAASLLLSPNCKEGLRAFRDRGVRPAATEPTSTRGCAHCDVSPNRATALPDLGTALAIIFVATFVRSRAGRKYLRV
jgi:hypothetical protein